MQRILRLQQNHIQRLIFLALAAVTFWGAVLGSFPPGGPGSGDAGAMAVPGEETGEAPGEAQGPEEDSPAKRIEPTPEEVKLLARTVYSEARGEHFTGQVAVAAVVLNRIADPDFPGSVSGVIFQPWAFTAVYDGQFWLEPNREAYRAVETALEGYDPTDGAVYYYNPVTATSRWIFSRPVIKRIGRHVFAG